MARFDVHRPSVISPEDYEFVCFNYLKVEDLGSAMFLAEEREKRAAHMKRTGGHYSGHDHAGNCGICGSVNAIYTALFYHPKTNSYVKTGLDCALKLECDGIEAFRSKVGNALEANAGKRKAKAVLEAAGYGAAWELYVAKADGRDEAVAVDMVSRLVKYGSLSPKAMNYLGVMVDRIKRAPEIAAARAAENAAAAPVPVVEGRMKVEGEVLTVKTVEGFYGTQVKMLVRHADGWKVWGTVPAAVAEEGIAKGDKVSFEAKVTVSKDDPKFGFASRPSKAKVFKTEVAA